MTRPALLFVLAARHDRVEPRLDHLHSEEAKRAARFWIGTEANKLRKSECIERLTRAWRDPKRAAEVVAALPAQERAVLAVVRRFGGSISGMLLRCELLARGIVREPTREERFSYRRETDPVDHLCERLILVGGRRDYHRAGYGREYPNIFLPPHIAAAVEPAASLKWKASASVEKPPESTSLRAPAQMMVDLEQTVRALPPQGGWKVNKGGTLNAGGRGRLGKLLPSRPNDPLEPPDRVVLDYSLLCALGVVEFDEADAWLKPERAERLFDLPQEAQASEWVRAWAMLRTWQDGVGGVPDRDDPEGSMRIDPYSLRKARELLLWALSRVAHSGGDWLDLETFLLDLYATTGEYGLSFYWHDYAWRPRLAAAEGKDKLPAGFERSRAFWMDDEAIWAANALLSTLVHLGLVERGRTGGPRSERWSFRLTEVGRAVFGAPEVQPTKAADGRQCLTIQPNHEILLYLDSADGAAVTTLGRIASRESTTGIVQTFKLTRQSVYEALEGGMTPGAIESFLSARSRNGLPANVSLSLAEWARKREALVVRTSVALAAGLPEGQGAVGGRFVGERFIVASPRVANKAAKDLRVTMEPEPPVGDWSVDEQGIVSPGERMSLVGKARLRRFASFSGGRWRITPGSVRAARDLGISADQILDWLGAHASHAVPALLATAIRNWASGRGKAFLGDVVLLQVDDPNAFDALRLSQRLQPLLLGTLAPGCLVVAAEMRDEAARLLGELGFSLDAHCKLAPATSIAPVSTPTPASRDRRGSARNG